MRERIQRNISGKMVGEFGSRLLSLALNLVLTRGLGAADYGRYAYAYAFAGAIALCGELGLNTMLMREAAGDKASAPGFVRKLGPLRFISIGVVIAVTLLGSLVCNSSARFLEIALLSGFMAANTIIEYHSAILSAFEKMGHDAALRISTRIAVSALGIIAIVLGAPLLSVLAFVMAGNIMSAAGGTIWRKQLGLSWGFEFDWKFMKQTLLKAIPVAIASLAGVLYFHMDSLVLVAEGFDDAAVGQYGAAQKILEAAHALPMVIVGAIFPVVAELKHSGGSAAVAVFFTRISRLCLIWMVPLAALCAVVAPTFVRFIYGAEYIATGPALSLLALAAPLYFSNLIVSFLFLAMGDYWFVGGFRLVACFIKLAAILLLYPWVGVLSPAVAMLIADGLLFVFLIAYRSSRGLSEPSEIAVIIRTAITAFVATCIWLLVTRQNGITVRLAAVSLVFAVAGAIDTWIVRPRSVAGLKKTGAVE